jgi:glucose/arabinose dehydrogenase
MRLKGLSLLALALVSSASFAQLRLEPVITSGISSPIQIIQDPTQPNVQFIVQQRGRIRVLVNGALSGTDALNISTTVSSGGFEKGLLGMAFDPQYATNGFIYISYTTGNTDASTVSWITRINRSVGNPNVFTTATPQNIFTINQPFPNHNGGTIKFGPDGMLYLGLGDGGSGGDPGDRAQNLSNLLGKFLRIDPRTDTQPDPNRFYSIPAGQPFTVQGGTLAPEIWSFGWRNPWKWSFDDPNLLGTGALVIADVGQDLWEEVDYEPAGQGGRNYGWRRKEGFSFFANTSGPNTQYRDPIHVYSHDDGISITGGHIYRGLELGDFFGRYFFADYGTQRVWSIKPNVDGSGEPLAASDLQEHTADLGLDGAISTGGISSIDATPSGELWIVGIGGRIYRIRPESRAFSTDFAVSGATQISGQLRSLSAPDEHVVSYRARFNADTIYGDGAALRIGYRYDGTPPNLAITVRARSNNSSLHTLRLGFRNWVTGKVQFVQTVNLTNAYQTFTTTPVPTTNLVRGDGRIEVVLAGNNDKFSSRPVETIVDYVRVN